MGNSPLASGCQFPEDPHAAAAPSLMARLRGDQIAQALDGLPPPTAKGQLAETIVDFDQVGPVRLCAIVKKSPGRHSHLYWAVEGAEAVNES